MQLYGGAEELSRVGNGEPNGAESPSLPVSPPITMGQIVCLISDAQLLTDKVSFQLLGGWDYPLCIHLQQYFYNDSMDWCHIGTSALLEVFLADHGTPSHFIHPRSISNI